MRRANPVEDLVHRTDSPFTASINGHPLPPKFKMPSLDSYDGTRDPFDHIAIFKTTMHLQGVPDEIMYRAFPTTLKRTGVSVVQQNTPKYKQGENESLWSFITRFNREALTVDEVPDLDDLEGLEDKNKESKEIGTSSLLILRTSSFAQKQAERLESLANWRDLLNLKGSVSVKPPFRLQTTSLLDDPEVFCRDKDKDELMKFLLGDIAQGTGVGKTTLAQLLYNDPGVMERFGEFRAWAHVSEDSDVFKITRTIFESFSLTDCNVTDLNVLQVRLKMRLSGRRFLFVLDDIWNENLIDWQLLLTPLKVGACGSRIIVTTRNISSVASIKQAVFTHHLLHLLDEECWSLFAKHAFRTSNPDEHPTLKRIGGKIVKKCRGLPLAAKTLGGLLQSEVEADEWCNILNSEIWDIPIDKSSILPALRLSYYHLPPHLKRCFAYCSIFPKCY
ncbi:putative disease resistance RPP13-like protein 1 [Quercus lobata]|uniref:putative disease resistance RPP13-like protein 1 n=1 Tax=Quercus lobata TaxID=97700 RepID=UPI0012455A29|nr:putative disease resistance RPP13-like protein 1 [Quercus lobata]